MQIINIKRFTCYNDMAAEGGSGINQEKLAGEMVGMAARGATFGLVK
jgi:hypothetical protein